MIATSLIVFALAAVPDGGSSQPIGAEPLWTGVSGGVQVSWTSERLVATRNGKTTFVEELAPSDGVGCDELGFESRALSLTGPFLSRYREDFGDCGGAHPICATGYTMIDLRTGKTADLFSLFGRETVMDALRRDSYIRKVMETGAGEEAGQTFESLQQALETHRQLSLDADSFYIHHLEKGRVAVRVGLTSSVHVTCGQKVELGLLLPIPPGLREAIELSANGVEGFIASNRPRVARWGKTRTGTPEAPLP